MRTGLITADFVGPWHTRIGHQAVVTYRVSANIAGTVSGRLTVTVDRR